LKSHASPYFQQQTQDTTKATSDTSRYVKTPYPLFSLKYRFGDPFSKRTPKSPLYFNNLNFFNRSFTVDSAKNINISEQLGSTMIRPPISLPFEEYSKLKEQMDTREFQNAKSAALDGESAVSNRGQLIPPIALSPFFDRLFGGDQIIINTNGFVQLDFGGRFQRIENPSIPIRQQRNGGFEFDQNINMSLQGTIGQKLKLNANFDNNNSFDFENSLKVEYAGLESDIIKTIEMGDVSMPIANSLISGAQNLFGFKTQMQFGKLFVTALASTQRGTSESIEIEGGIQRNDFEIRGSDYDENRHFFLGHHFRQNFENWLRAIPQVVSGLDLARVEVYVLNRSNNTQTLRNFTAFMDLGEGDVIFQDGNPKIGPGTPGSPASNDANDLFDNLTSDPRLRRPDQISGILEAEFGFEKAQDFERVTGARKLDPSEYTFNRQLGFISLSRQLQNDEVLAVAYEYNLLGIRYKVGELTEDYQSRNEEEVIFLKMLRPGKINTRVPTWELMMKNIYDLNASQIEQPGFELRVIYRDDDTGLDNPSLHEGENTKDIPLIEIMGLDKLNQNNDPQKDGNFDFVEGVTINPDRGYMMFPFLQPFGDQLEKQFTPSETFLKDKYVFDTLYATTRADAQLISNLNKFFIKGSFQAGSSSEINLNAFQIAQGSVQVYAGNTPLQEGADFTVDYSLGRVNIINPSIINSGKKIRVTYEKADLFNFQTRSLLGTRLDYVYNDKINIGGTLMHLNERPQFTRVGIGNEPVSNTMWGIDVNYSNESRLLTKMVDALPFIDTKAPSSLTFSGEFAQLLPGTSNKVEGKGTSYIDDFESTVTPFSLGNPISWKMGSTPKTDDGRFDLSPISPNRLGFNYKRARIAWYTIDNIFYRTNSRDKPSNIDEDDLKNHYTRSIGQQEVIKRDKLVIAVNQPAFDIAYFPSERGIYNYNPDLNPNGELTNPKSNFGAITRAITNEVDFDKTNIEYIETWIMDPFINTTNGTPDNPNGIIVDGSEFPTANTQGGKLIFNLGSISEDVILDERHAFEQGLPNNGSIDPQDVVENEWGFVTRQPYLNPAFDNEETTRNNQDVGLDGLKSVDEVVHFDAYIQSLNLNNDALEKILTDPSADNFQYYLGDELDQRNAKILERYKLFNGLEGNSPIITNGNTSYTPSATNLPDNEDLNRDNTLADLEEYYEYEINLRPNQMVIGKNYIVDKVTNEVNGDQVTWYLFRIPVRKPDRVQGNINGFKSIRYLRTYLTDFAEPVVLRFVNLRLVGSQWRTYQENLFEKGLFEVPEASDPNFTVSVVSIEENSQGGVGTPPYFVPPGIVRDRDNTSTIERRRNEQSMQLCVENLIDRDSRAVFKNVNQDFVNYGRIKMFLHGHSEQNLAPGDVSSFLRMGTDFTQNYYEIEVPLTMSPINAVSARETWPEENEINLEFSELYKLKSLRNQENSNINLPYSIQFGKYKLTIVGRPDLSTVQTLMIGIRNPSSPDQQSKSVCIWVNELRVTDFDSNSGWAANARLDAQLADFGNISASIRHSSIGFGGISDKISDRNRERTTQYDISTGLKLDKFFPERWGLELPVFFSFENSKAIPQFDPLDPDLPLDNVLDAITDPVEREDYRKKVIDQSKRRSFNFSNIRKRRTNTTKAQQPFDIENFSFTYAYNEVTRSNINTASYSFKNYRSAINYAFQPKEWFIEPFKNSKSLDSPFLKLIKDINFNPIPNSIVLNGNVNRNFMKTQLRNANLTTEGIDPYFEKSFTFDRSYALNWNLTKSLTFDYRANVLAIIDEPEGDLDSDIKRDSVRSNFWRMGRTKDFGQSINVNYTLPFDKIPVTDWISSDINYSVNYGWKAGAVGQSDSLGNEINNNREITVTGKIDMVKLYNKIGVLKKINSPTRSRSRSRATVPTNDSTKVKKTIDDRKIVKGLLRVLMSLRNVTFNFDVSEGTYLPGYTQDVFLFGLDKDFSNPGLGFVLGSQDPTVRNRIADNGYMATSQFVTRPFSQNKISSFSFSALLEPFTDFRVTVTGRKTHSQNYQEIFKSDQTTGGDVFISINPNRTGSYGITYFMMKTAFAQKVSSTDSPLFNDFETNRIIVKNRLDGINEKGSYDINSQDVTIPAFLAAYSGKSAQEIKLTAFPKTPIPNWSMNYRGLTKVGSLGDIFTNINISHAYSSRYDVSNYSNSLLYSQNLTLDNDITNSPLASEFNDEGSLVSIYIAQQAVLSEKFSPLIGVNIRTKGDWDFSIDYSRERHFALNLSNVQVTELSAKDLDIKIGFAKSGVKIPFRINGRKQILPNELRFNMGLVIRDSKTVQQRIGERSTITDGIRIFRLSPTLDYSVSDKLQVSLYFERNVNDPKVTTSFLNARTAFGGRIRFSLSQ